MKRATWVEEPTATPMARSILSFYNKFRSVFVFFGYSGALSREPQEPFDSRDNPKKKKKKKKKKEEEELQVNTHDGYRYSSKVFRCVADEGQQDQTDEFLTVTQIRNAGT